MCDIIVTSQTRHPTATESNGKRQFFITQLVYGVGVACVVRVAARAARALARVKF